MKSPYTLDVETRGDREIVMKRFFDAPRRLVFQAWTRPELLKRWLGVFGGHDLVVCEIDLRVGGAFRYVWRAPDGAEMGLRGVYHEIIAPERIVTIGAFDTPWYPGSETSTVTLAEEGDNTMLTHTVLYDSREARDMVIKSPMAKGVGAGYDALDAVLVSLRTTT
jgi:uncharacterized protein YndB with AHSA1/START domain